MSILWWCPHVSSLFSSASSSCSSHTSASALPGTCPSKHFPGHFSHPRPSCVSERVPASSAKSRLSSSLLMALCSSVPSPLTTFWRLSLLSWRWNTFSSMEPAAKRRYR